VGAVWLIFIILSLGIFNQSKKQEARGTVKDISATSGESMKTKILVRPETAFVGIEASGSITDAPVWIPTIWSEARQYREELRDAPLKDAGVAWGIMSSADVYLERWSGGGRYLAGWEVSEEFSGFGRWSVWRVPPTYYAVSECTFETMATVIKSTDEFIKMSEEFEAGGAIHECYPPSFRGGATDPFFLYFTLRQKPKKE
jgi:hypothetical protein